MQTPRSLINKLNQEKVVNYINQKFDETAPEIKDVNNIFIVIPENWSFEELKIADIYLKEWGWDSSIEEKYNISPDSVPNSERYIKIFPMQTISEEELGIIKAKEIFLRSQNIDLTRIDKKILIEKNESNPYTEAFEEGENNV